MARIFNNRKENPQVRANFTEKELRSGSWREGYNDAPPSFELSDTTLDALQMIRDFYGEPIKVNSTLRSPKHNTAIGGAKFSRHLELSYDNGKEVRAIDFTTKSSVLTQIKADLKNKNSEIFKKIYAKGIRGIGIYNNFIHIDSRPTQSHGKMHFWDVEKKNIKTPKTAI